jgi:hypothetical protein
MLWGSAVLIRLRSNLSPRVVAMLLTVALAGGIMAFGEPSRPATATVVRPIMTVQALCTQPTIIDVAAREATRGLSAVNSLLDLEEPLVLDAAREVSITETEVGTYFVWVGDGELRLSLLRATGLPLLAFSSDEEQRRTHRTFDLPPTLAGQDVTVFPDDDAVYVLFSGGGEPVSAIRLDTDTLTAESADLRAGRAPEEVEVDDVTVGRAVGHGRVLWLASDDGSLWAYDAAVDASDQWQQVDEGLVGGLLAAGDDGVHGVVAGGGNPSELRSWTRPDRAAMASQLAAGEVTVAAASVPNSKRPGFLIRDADRTGLLTPDGDPEVTWTDGSHPAGPVHGVILHEATTALMTVTDEGLTYHVLDRDGQHVGSFSREADEPACGPTLTGRDVHALAQPLSAGGLLYLHHPGSRYDCAVDTGGDLGDLEVNCGPEGSWVIDKGSAPDSDFTIEIERALEELREDEANEDPSDAPEPEAPDAESERLEDEFAEVGLGIQEVDEDLAEACADEEVTAVPPPDLEGLETVGDRGIRVEWSWSGGRCLPERYIIDVCLVSSDGDGCSDSREDEVVDRDGASNRLSTQVSSRPGRTYRVSVSAVKQGVRSSPSRMMSIATPTAVPDIPEDVRATLSEGTWHIRWSSCLDDRSCNQRPDGFVVTVEGCEGDSLPRQTHRLGAGERSVRYDVGGSGFQGTQLLGRRVRFTVAAVAAGHTSDRVSAGPCAESLRSGRTVSYDHAPVRVALTGRGTRMTLDVPGRSAGLVELFGRSSFDDVSARLVRNGSSTRERRGALGSSVTFEVRRCELSGWTVELTPRQRGRALTNHQARITGVPAACDWNVTESTSTSARADAATASSTTVAVTIPGLADDVRTDKVRRVTATSACRRWNGGTSESSLSAGRIDGDVVTFSMPTPPVFDLAGACTIAPRIEGRDGGTVVPRRADLDLRRVERAIVQRVGPEVVEAMRSATTGAYVEGRGGGLLRRNDRVRVTIEGSGLDCVQRAGGSTWEIGASGGQRSLLGSLRRCSGQRHTMEFGSNDLDNGRANVTYKVGLVGGATHTVTRQLNVCALPEGRPRPPCQEIEACEWDPDIPADSSDCYEPCEWNSDISADDDGCREPEPDPEPDPDPGEGDGDDDPGDDPDGGDDGAKDPGDEDPGDEDPGDGTSTGD